MPLTVFVTDGNQRSALAIVRTLGRRGMTVIVGDEQPVSLASASRHCAHRITYPSPYAHREAFERFLLDFVAREHVDVLLPVTDVTTHSVCALQDRLEVHTALAVPPLDAFEIVTHKGRLMEYAASLAVPVPRTHCVDGLESLERVVDRVEYPAVVKPVRSRLRTEDGWVPGRVHYAGSPQELRTLYRDHEYLAAHPSLIQQRIAGAGIGVFVLFDRGQLVADFAHRRLREKPPTGGVSVLCESEPVADSLRDHAIRMLGPLGWHGVAMLEYKQDLRTGECFLIEVNGRFWGSLQLAVDAGMDFPALACELALGHRPQVLQPYKLGVRSRWLLGDFDHLLLRLFTTDRSSELPASVPSRLRTLRDFITCANHGSRDGIGADADFGPFVHELREYVRALVASAARRAGRRRTSGARVRSQPAPSHAMVDR
jgi:predicted ATP-grasp superfamily ATP-dependent carboligase